MRYGKERTKQPRRKRHRSITIPVIILIVLGCSVLLYPIISDRWAAHIQTQSITEYTTVADRYLTSRERDEAIARARSYNESLAQVGGSLFDLAEKEDDIGGIDALDIEGNGIIGYVTIDKINVEVPIYRSDACTDAAQRASVHLAGTSLPIGGKNTHCVIYAHRGLVSAQLFSNLDQLTEGDTFQISVLNETHTYEVDQIQVVKPEDDSTLSIIEDQDFCTLLTCTPYGVNTHRLLVRGKRVEAASVYEPSNTDLFPIVVFVLVVIAIGGVALAKIRKKHRQEQIRRNRWKKGLQNEN